MNAFKGLRDYPNPLSKININIDNCNINHADMLCY